MDTIAIAIAKKNKPTQEQVDSAVNNWLDDHPEATTTVQDGAITRAKLDADLQQKTDEVSELKSAIEELAVNIIIDEYGDATLSLGNEDLSEIEELVGGDA